MGLDVVAYSKVVGNFLGPAEQFSESERDKLYVEDKVVRIYVAARAHADRLDGHPEGFYRYKGKALSFRAGSYSGYNWWRRHLCLMAHHVEPEVVWRAFRKYRGKPFVELIDFSDCEGAIGPATSKKLAEDFRAHSARAEEYVRSFTEPDPNRGELAPEDVVDEEWLESYREWQKAFELAAKDGFVVLC